METKLNGSSSFTAGRNRIQCYALSVLALLATSVAADSMPVTIHADVWADNWFGLYVGETLVKEDSVSITTERSFNAESFTFTTELPVVLNFIVKDFKQDDTGLEYIGTRRQQMGDGGLIAQFFNAKTEANLLVSDDQWRCISIHTAPLNKACEKSADPAADCTSSISAEPTNWQSTDFDDSSWPNAVVHSVQTVSPKGGYDAITWHNDAELIWTSDLEADNTLLCRVVLQYTGD
jgi:hypothetical protein